MVYVAFSLGGHNVGLFTNVGINGEGFRSGEQNESLELISACCSVSDASCVSQWKNARGGLCCPE